MSVRLFVVLGVLLLVSAGANVVQLWHAGNLHERIGADASALRTLGREATAQNKAVAHWQAQAREAEKQLRAAEASAQKARRQSDAAASKLMVAPVPAQCERAMQWAAVWGRKAGRGWDE